MLKPNKDLEMQVMIISFYSLEYNMYIHICLSSLFHILT